MSEIQDALNKLIICESSIGKIKYVGPVYELKDDKEIWYGIEWMDASRGKHDGSFKGRRYFTTRHLTGGSFVRPNKVEFGVDIAKAVNDKYLKQDDIENIFPSQGEEEILYNNFKINNQKSMIKCVNLAYCKISRLGSLDFFNTSFPFMNELDIESNLLDSWSTIFQLLGQLKQIKILNISNNLLTFPDSSSEHQVFEGVEHLIMNKLNYDWTDIQIILKHFPNLVELKVCFNCIEQIDCIGGDLLKKLKILDLESNPIKEWKHFKQFGHLKELETLYANDIGIYEINFEETGDLPKTSLFPKLKTLSLNDNRIDQWKSVNELNKLPSLEELMFKFNPLNNTDQLENIRQFFIAKLGGLKVFNRTKFTRQERKGAEIDYLKKFGKQWLELTGSDGSSFTPDQLAANKSAFLAEHPRFTELVQRYGAAEKSEVNVQPDTVNTSLIWINLKDEASGGSQRKKIPLTTDIQRLKYILARLFKYPVAGIESIKLFYINNKDPTSEYELDNNLRTLNFYSIASEDTILLRTC